MLHLEYEQSIKDDPDRQEYWDKLSDDDKFELLIYRSDSFNEFRELNDLIPRSWTSFRQVEIAREHIQLIIRKIVERWCLINGDRDFIENRVEVNLCDDCIEVVGRKDNVHLFNLIDDDEAPQGEIDFVVMLLCELDT